ncbi:hypothetical protein ALC57_09350, partial [Trachymyrmex cornetzi]
KRGRTPYVRRSSRNRLAPIEPICRPTVIVTPQPAATALLRVPTPLTDTTIAYTPVSYSPTLTDAQPLDLSIPSPLNPGVQEILDYSPPPLPFDQLPTPSLPFDQLSTPLLSFDQLPTPPLSTPILNPPIGIGSFNCSHPPRTRGIE